MFGVVLIGLWLLVVSLGMGALAPGTLHAPRWVLGAIDTVLMLGGRPHRHGVGEPVEPCGGARYLGRGLRRIRAGAHFQRESDDEHLRRSARRTHCLGHRVGDRIGLGRPRVAAGIQAALKHGQRARHGSEREGRIDSAEVFLGQRHLHGGGIVIDVLEGGRFRDHEAVGMSKQKL